jgi:hypothetical protein
MSSNKEILQQTIVGIPRVAERIVELPEEQRQKAFEAVQRSYLQTVLDLDYAEAEARDWVGAVMDTLRAEVDEQARDEPQVPVDHDGFASLERTMKLLVRAGAGSN